MLQKVYVPLNSEERQALIKLASIKRRDPRVQAAYLIRQSLERLNLLPPAPVVSSEYEHEEVKNEA